MLFLIIRHSPGRKCFLFSSPSSPRLRLCRLRLGGRFHVVMFRGANKTGFKEKPYQRAPNNEDKDGCSHGHPGNKGFDYVLDKSSTRLSSVEHTFIRKDGPGLTRLLVFIAKRNRSRDAYSGVFPEVGVDMRFEDIASKGINEGGTPSIWLRKCVSMSTR